MIFVAQTLFLPGDNDIGGEDELVTESKVSRFQKHFHPLDSLRVGHVHFMQVGCYSSAVPTAFPVFLIYKNVCAVLYLTLLSHF